MKVVAELRSIGKYYGSGEVRIHALQGIDLQLRAGEVTLVEGPSGSGKTTLLQILGLLLPPDEGSCTICGREWTNSSQVRLTEARRRHIAFVFQDFNLLSSLSAHDNVAVVAQLHQPRGDAAAQRILSQLAMTGRADHLPGQLSGGQKQRVSIARALASKGELILADEPTANLDWGVGEPIVRLLSSAAHDQGRCVVLVSHDARLEPYADRIVRMSDGRIQSDQMNPNRVTVASAPADAALPADRAPRRHLVSRLAVFLAILILASAGLTAFTFLRPGLRATDAAPAADPAPRGGPSGAPGSPSTAAPQAVNGVVAAAPATIEPASRIVQIASDRTGTIKRILVQSADRVTVGQALVQLDDEEAQSMLKLRTAEWKFAQAALDDLLAGTRPERKEEVEAQAAEAQARLDRAQFEYERVEGLLKNNAVGAADARAAQETLAVCKGEVKRTQALLKLARNGPTATEIERARALVAQADANRNVAQVTLDRRFITSPIAGRVLYINLEPGEVVSDLVVRPIMSLAAAGKPRLRAEVDEIDISRVHVGQQIGAVSDSFPDRSFRGTVVRMENLMGRRNVRTGRPTEQQDTRVREVLIELDESAADLPVDLLMTVRFLADTVPTTQPH